MLVLSRKIGEKIKIGTGDDAIILCVVGVDRNIVRIGLDARPGIPIQRTELGDRIEKAS